MKLIGAGPKGSLEKPFVELFNKTGYRLRLRDRSCFPSIDDEELELILVRPQEIPRYVAEGKFDWGITGWDCIVEADCEKRVIQVGELVFSKASRKPTVWVAAVAETSDILTISDLDGRKMSSEMVNMTRKWLTEQRIEGADVTFSWGATEAKPRCHLCDVIVEATESGDSLKQNGLRIVAEVLRSTPRFIANPSAFEDPLKRRKMEDLCRLLRSTLLAEDKVMLMMNIEDLHLKTIVRMLPSLKGPTLGRLSQEGWWSVCAVVEETAARDLIPRLQRAGATGIIELPITKVVEDIEDVSPRFSAVGDVLGYRH